VVPSPLRERARSKILPFDELSSSLSDLGVEDRVVSLRP
jgi:hypothetical protein